MTAPALWLLAAVTAGALLVADGAAARNSSSSGGSHSSGSHTSTRSHTTNSRSGGATFMRKTCKTDACLKKHPTGNYVIPMKPRKQRSG